MILRVAYMNNLTSKNLLQQQKVLVIRASLTEKSVEPFSARLYTSYSQFVGKIF
jgi:hypothetical protein